MESKCNNELIFPLQSSDYLKPELAPHIQNLFLYHWERILKNVGFYTSTYLQEDIDRMRNSHFWQALITEILENTEYSVSSVSAETGAPADFIHKLHRDKPNTLLMPLAIGEKLLLLHRKARFDLQKKEELQG